MVERFQDVELAGFEAAWAPMLVRMNDDLLGPSDDTPPPTGHWTTTVPARQVALDEVRSEADRDLDRLATEHDAKMGLHPPAATIKRVG